MPSYHEIATEHDTITCDICGNSVRCLHEAISNGWSPEYYEGDAAHPCGPVCGRCWDMKFVNTASDGELELTERGRRAIAARVKTNKRLKLELYGVK